MHSYLSKYHIMSIYMNITTNQNLQYIQKKEREKEKVT